MQQRTPAEVLRLVQDEGIEIVDVRFVDLPGLMQHFSVPATRSRRTCSRKASGSTDRRSGDSTRSRSWDVCSWPTPTPPWSTPSASTAH